MSANDPNQPQGGSQGTDAAPQAESGQHERGGAGGRQQQHGRHRRGGGGGGRQPQRGQGQPQQSRRSESALNMDELRELTDLFSSHGLTDFEFENADIRIRLSRNPAPVTITSPAIAPQQPAMPAPAATTQAAAQTSAQQAQPEAAQSSDASAAEDLHIIPSPIVGTFYRSPSPNAEPFIKVGSEVEPATVVCIIEAMKLMNEIQAETSGTIEKIYVENGQPVEYGQPLFGVKR